MREAERSPDTHLCPAFGHKAQMGWDVIQDGDTGPTRGAAMRTETVISEGRSRGDLSEPLSQVIGKDGEHVVFDGGDGRQLLAEVSAGRVVNWRAMEPDGREVATVVIRQPDSSPGPSTSQTELATARRARWAIVCACFESGDFCWWQPY